MPRSVGRLAPCPFQRGVHEESDGAQGLQDEPDPADEPEQQRRGDRKERDQDAEELPQAPGSRHCIPYRHGEGQP